MKATAAHTTASAARVALLEVGRLSIGTITVGQLNVTNARVGITSGQARLENVRVTVSLDFRLEWRIFLDGPGPLNLEESGSNSLGGIDIPFAFGNAEIPGLRNINLDIANLTAPDLRAEADPVTGVRATGLVAEAIQARELTLPAAGFQLAGLGLNTVDVDDVAVPAVAVESATVGRVHGDPLSLPALRLTGLALPAASAGNITSGPLDIPLTRDEFRLPALDLGFFSATLIVVPSARTRVQRMQMSGVRATASADAIELRDVRLPYDATDLTLADLGIETIEIPTITVS